MKNGIVTFEIAKAAKSKGYNEQELYLYYSLEDTHNYNGKLVRADRAANVNTNTKQCNSECDIYCTAMTYHKLIDWVFDSKINSTGRLLCTLEEYNKWLKFWYNLLKDCPLKYEFKGRMLEYFRSNDQILVLNHWTKQPINGSIWENVYRPIINNIEYLTFFDTYEEAEHQGILEVFKLLKKN